MDSIPQRIVLTLLLLLGAFFLITGVRAVLHEDKAPLPLYDFDADSEITFDGLDHSYALSGVHWDNYCQDNDEMPKAQTWTNVETILETGDPVLLIPSICVATPVGESGMNAEGLLTLPDPPYATHYEKSAEFGASQGNAVVASHVDYNYGENAPFSRLHRIEKGAPIVVVEPDGTRHDYVASSNAIYEMQELPDSVFQNDGEHTLNIVTCSGSTLTNEHNEAFYEYNLVVSAELVD